MIPLKDDIPTDRFPVITVLLIVLNAVAYLVLQQKSGIDLNGTTLDQGPLTHYAAIPYELTHPGKHCDVTQLSGVACEGQPGTAGTAESQLPTWVTPFTAMFTHAGLLHLGGNMLFLWIFGNNVEDSMGRVRFVVFYLLGGLVAIAAQTVVDPNAAVPTLGASGAVAGVLGGYLLLYPRARVLTIILFFFVMLPAYVVLGFWFLQQLYFSLGDLTQPEGGSGGVAYLAHVGGFVFGLLLIKVFVRKRNEAADAPRMAVW